MPCRKPLEAVRRPGQKPIIYKAGRRPKTLAEGYEALELPCGQCRGCRLEESRIWGARIAHEAAYIWEEFNLPSTMITLTYDEKHLPMYGSLVPKHLQDFFKRFRERLSRNAEPAKIRYYASGEYGTTCPKHNVSNCPICGPIQRPHYHAIVLGWGFPDRHCIGYREGFPVYESQQLGQLWDKGFHEIGSCSFESAAYVARYVMKKQTGKAAETHYQRCDPWTTQWHDVEPEFAIMSTGHTCKEHRGMEYQVDCPKCSRGIGYNWAVKYMGDLYPKDELPIPGRGVYGVPPAFYDEIYDRQDGSVLADIKDKRRREFAQSLVDGPSLESRAKVQDAKIQLLGRKL